MTSRGSSTRLPVATVASQLERESGHGQQGTSTTCWYVSGEFVRRYLLDANDLDLEVQVAQMRTAAIPAGNLAMVEVVTLVEKKES